MRAERACLRAACGLMTLPALWPPLASVTAKVSAYGPPSEPGEEGDGPERHGAEIDEGLSRHSPGR